MNVSAQFSIRTKMMLDLVMLILIMFLSISMNNFEERSFSGDQVITVSASLIFWLFSARLMGIYRDYRETPFSIEWVAFLKTVSFYAMISAFAFFLLLKDYGFSRKEMLYQLVAIFFMLPVQKVIVRIIFKRIKIKNTINRRVLIVGAGSNGMDFYQQYVQKENNGYTLTGFLHEEQIHSLNGSYLGKISDIDRILAKYETDDIVITQTTDETILEKIVSAGEKRERGYVSFQITSGLAQEDCMLKIWGPCQLSTCAIFRLTTLITGC